MWLLGMRKFKLSTIKENIIKYSCNKMDTLFIES